MFVDVRDEDPQKHRVNCTDLGFPHDRRILGQKV